MPLPHATRRSDILSKLEYAEERRNQLMRELLEAKYEDRDPKFLRNTASEIVSVARECFDYLGKDIIEGHIIPLTKKQKLRESYQAGTLKAYFPFHLTQIQKQDSPFQELEEIYPPLHRELIAFIEAIHKQMILVGTNFDCSQFLQMQDMVNEKKHDRLVRTISEDEQEILIKGPSGIVLIPLKEQAGWDPNSLEVLEKHIMKKANEYRFEFNGCEVGRFCMFAVGATHLIMDKFYKRHFTT